MFKIKNLTNVQKELRKMILKISFEQKHSHLGSCLSAVDIIEAIYEVKEKKDPFILSNGHAGMALYVVLAKHGFLTEDKIRKLNIHPDRNPEYNIFVSTGSLGQGLPIALGMALANKKRSVYCVLSDGECTEGSIWEALRIAAEYRVANLKIAINANGWGAYGKINNKQLAQKITAFGWKVIEIDGHNINSISKALKLKSKLPLALILKTSVNQLPFLKNQDAHYYVMNDSDYQQSLKLLK